MKAAARSFDVHIESSSLVGVSPGAAVVTLDEDLVIESRYAQARLPIDALTGCRLAGHSLILALGDRGSLELTCRAADELARAITERACVLPELTLAMRSLGSRHGGPAGEHDRFFGPLLRARVAAEKARDVSARMRSFDAVALEQALTTTITALAAERNDRSLPHRRAMEAQILEFAEPLLSVLRALRADAGPGDDAIAAWCSWAAGVRAVFAESDRFWQRTRRFLDASPSASISRGSGAGGN